MSCDDKRCLPPDNEEFTFDLKIVSPGFQATQEGVPLKSADNQLDLGDDSSVSTSSDSGYTPTGESDSTTNKTSDSRSLWLFFVISFVAGLAALLTPCVFPMIPMTVTFFMREGRKRIKGIMIGLVFGLSIILIYTSIGFIVSLTSVGPDAAK